MRQTRVPITITILAVLFLFTSFCHAQFTPPPVAGFVNPGTGWTPLTGNVGTGVSFSPPPAAIYSCVTVVSGVCTSWGPWTGSGGGGGGTVTSVTFTGDGTVLSSTPSAPVTTSGTLAATLANAGAGTVLGNNTASAAAPTYSSAPVLGVDNATAGTLQLANSAASAHTIWASGATTTNTIKGFATAPTTTDLITCTTASTTCTLTDSGKALTGAGAAVPTGPTSSTTNDVVTFTGTAGQIADSGVLASQLVTSSSSLTSNSVVLGAGSQGSKTVAGFTTDGTSVLTLGVAGTSVGGVAFNNATSGSITLNPATGALGAVTATLPANTGTIAELNLAQTFSGATTFSANGAASTPTLSLTGSCFVGTGTTSTPCLYINQGTAPTTWSTSTGGTMFGLNAVTGFAGNFLDFHLNGGASVLSIQSNGNVNTSGLFNSTGALALAVNGAGNPYVRWGPSNYAYVNYIGTAEIAISSASGNSKTGGILDVATTNVSAYNTTTNCAAVGTAASPSVVSCSAANAGAFSCATNASAATCTINTTAVTANSEIIVTAVADEGTRLGVTCNTAPTAPPAIILATKTGGTGFTINLPTFSTNPVCYDYIVMN